MEIYKFFYPHFNPLLLASPLRQQELSELSQCASLMRRAIEHAQRRNTPPFQRKVHQQRLQSAQKALRYVEDILQELEEDHPGDTALDINSLARERALLPGWKSWSALVKEQVRSLSATEIEDETLVEPKHNQPAGSTVLKAS